MSLTEEQAYVLVEFIEENWEQFELNCKERAMDSEDIYQAVQKVALNDNSGN